MNQTIYFTVSGKPQPKQRAKTVRLKTGASHTYTPDATVKYERRVRAAFLEVAASNLNFGPSFPPHTGPVHLDIIAVFGIPKSWSKRKRERAAEGGGTWCPSCCDADNIAKIVSDALNGVAYVDDRQIVYELVMKQYGPVSHVLVSLTFLKED